MTSNKHTEARGGAGRVLANLALGAGLVLAACGTTQAPAATNATNETGNTPVVRDPDNAHWSGNAASDGTVSGGSHTSLVRDPENPYWTGRDAGCDH
jgi:hypothetical protein